MWANGQRDGRHHQDGQEMLCYATSNNLCFCTTWQNGKHENCIFTRCISGILVHWQNSTSCCCCLTSSFFDSRLIVMLPYDSLTLVINAFSSGCWGHGSGKRKSTALQQLYCVARTMHVHQCAIFLKEKMSSVMCLIASNLSWDCKISH